MAPDEMDQDHRQKSGRELEDMVQDRMRAKEHEIRELREEIRGKEQEIRELREEISGVEKEIAIAARTEVRASLEAKLQFLRLQIISLREEIKSLNQQIISRDQQISGLWQEVSSHRSLREASASAGVLEKLLQELAEYMAEKKAKGKLKKSVHLSSVSQYIWGALKRQEGLEMVFKDFNPKPKRLSDVPAFGWDDRQERLQADRYISHLNKIASGRNWKLIDAANNHPTLLSGYHGGWNFKGTTDAAFVHREAGKAEPRLGLGCIFELKKDLRSGRYKAMIRTVICLVMANVFAKQFRPFAVLTDLDESWSLYWMDGSTIHWHDFESRACAVGCIEELLQDSDDNKMGTSETLPIQACPHGEDEDLLVIK